MGNRFSVVSALALAMVLVGALGTAQETTSGSIEGSVVDTKGAPLPGVTINLTSAQGTKSETTDSNGAFRFNFLVPGSYKLEGRLQGFNTVERQNIDVNIGARVRIQVTMAEGMSETIDVVGSAPVVDIQNPNNQTNISAELMQSVPLGRTFGETLAVAPGVVDSGVDASNPSIGGASGLENTYVVDGVNIGNAGYGSAGSYSSIFGSLGTGVNFDYIQEVQVKTGGYEPEFGEALGGQVNLVTKTGGNELKGSGYVYYAPHWGEGERKELEVTTSNFVAARQEGKEVDETDVGIEAGGPLAKDKAFVYGAFNPSFESFTRQTLKAVSDAQGFNHRLKRERKIWNYAANLKWFPTAKHTFTFSSFGDPSEGEPGSQRSSSLIVADPTTRFSEIKYGGHNLVGKWAGELASNWFFDASIAWHKDKFDETPATNLPQGSDRRVSPFRSVGGIGFLNNNESRRTQYTAIFSNFFNAGGEHNIRYGFDYQDIGFDVSTEYSGPAGAVTTPDGLVSTTGFTYRILLPSATFPFETFQVVRTRFQDELFTATQRSYTAFHVKDTWNITKYLNVMAGVRYEKQHLQGAGPGSSEHTWKDNWGPRFSLSWDPTQDNKTKLSFGWGRSFGAIPSDLAVRAMSAELQATLRYRLSDVNISDINNPVINPTAIPLQNITIGSHPTIVCGQKAFEGVTDAEISALCNGQESKITFQDQWSLSAEREIIPALNLGVTFLRRDLGQTMEDFAIVPYSQLVAGTAEFGNYIIGNPSVSYPDLFPDPTRKYNSLTFSANKRMRDNWQMLASYTWSKLEGNYEGYYRRDNGQDDPFITSLFDFPYLADADIWGNTFADGVLPNDRKHVFNLYGSYLWGKFNIGMGFKVQSGLPINRLGFNEAYGNGGEILLEERAGSGRGDTTTSFDLHFDYPLNLGGGSLSLVMDVFNLFNSQKGVNYDQEYEVGGSVAVCGPSCVNVDFAKPYQYQDPRSVRFAARYNF